DPDTRKPVANTVIFEYDDEPDRYVLTFTRKKDIFRMKFVDQIHGLKNLLARLIRFDAAYLRFTGDLRLDHYRGDQLIESLSDDAIWELMYFGRVPQLKSSV